MGARQAFRRAMSREGRAVAGMTTISTFDMLRAAGSAFPEAHVDGAAMARVARAGVELYGLPSVRVPFDLTIGAEAMGWSVDLGDDRRYPEVVKEERDPSPLDTSSPRCLALARAMGILGDGAVPVIVGTVSPFTMLCSTRGIEDTLMLTHLDPEGVERAMSPLAEGILQFLKWAREGADCLIFSESFLSPDILPPSTAERMLPPLRPLLREAEVLHCCGDVTDLLPQLAALVPRGLSIEEMVRPEAVREAMPGTAVIGNVGVVRPLLQGSPEEVRAAAEEALSSGVDILSPACGVAPGTPRENLRAMVGAMR